MVFYTRIITLLLLMHLAYSAACTTKFVDDINVRVFNEDYVRIGGATVSVTYQLDRTTAKGYFTATKITNEDGEANFTLVNLEVQEENLDCGIDIAVHFDEETAETTVTAQAHPNPVNIIINAHLLIIHVVDQNDRPIQGAEVFVQNRTAMTDSNGRARFIVGQGTVHVLVKYDIGKVEQDVEVTAPLEHTVGFGFYPFRLRIIDDRGNLLPVQVTVEEEEYEVNGELEVQKVARSAPTVEVAYGNTRKNLQVDLAVQGDYTVIFDLTAPILGEVEPLPSGNQLKLEIDLADEGSYASGINANGIRFSYHYDTDNWETKRVYVVTQNKYGVDLPLKPGAAILFFTIEASDVEGNKGIFEGQLPLGDLSPAVNETRTEPEEEEEQEGLPILPLVAFGVVALLIYIIYRFKLSKGEGGEM